jgi:hypothetical protein
LCFAKNAAPRLRYATKIFQNTAPRRLGYLPFCNLILRLVSVAQRRVAQLKKNSAFFSLGYFSFVKNDALGSATQQYFYKKLHFGA